MGIEEGVQELQEFRSCRMEKIGITGDRRQETGDRRQETGDRRQETGDRRQETGSGLVEDCKILPSLFWLFLTTENWQLFFRTAHFLGGTAENRKTRPSCKVG
jgi:hypothetical protein